ncbi:hypothetical protein CFBP3846_02693 [Pseudomonas syringae pv. avii]|uniref:Uncharacterized protein n=2 Tax=Pseudomonas syringae group TaxID=136849 RepID=A0ABY1U6V6_PSESX|nr:MULTISPECIES: hypothetical protein [Pseudomonas syringae group]KWS99753.1 hypothetical protein AL046_08055 [Pseudomonas syringae pv. avii]PHN68532.1 hypothetical protein AO286_13500 [Pseudomonas syringae]POQ08498.1 hypothetical protein CXB40_09465 [Pseudomonas syringae pv. avii]RMR22340.1 hypothetical protein ALP89_00526 [Pseudomonas syringae pv. persicae]SOS27111.1 hypothetical protein CFBP3846_02693 [Pseudomonas syringae pv. avii]
MDKTIPEKLPDPNRPYDLLVVETDPGESEVTGGPATPLKATHPQFNDTPADLYPVMENQTGMPFSSFYRSRYIGFASIAVVVIGIGVAISFLSLRSDWFQVQKALALFALWFANLISTVLNASYWFIRRGPKWLAVLLGVQLIIVMAGAVPTILND